MCLEELEHSTAEGGKSTIEFLLIDPGYWRATNTSINILECYNAKACLGGVTGRSGYCKTGHEGPCQYILQYAIKFVLMERFASTLCWFRNASSDKVTKHRVCLLDHSPEIRFSNLSRTKGGYLLDDL